jgi:hypothetical protein
MSRLLWTALAIAVLAASCAIEPCDDSSGHSCKHEITQ